MSDQMPMTRKGMMQIQAELDHLIKVEREDLKKIIAEARALGDLKENAEYQSAKEKQSYVEGRILQLQNIVTKAVVIDVSSVKSEKIVFGAKVTLIDEDGNKTVYRIVGADETDMKNGKISYNSPLGKALIGKEKGDTVVVKAPKGDLEYEVEFFEFIEE